MGQQDLLPLHTPAPWAGKLQPLCLPAACVGAGIGAGYSDACRKGREQALPGARRELSMVLLPDYGSSRVTLLTTVNS